MIAPGVWLRSKEPREEGRGVRVLGIYHPFAIPGLRKSYATVYSQGRVSVFSLDRLSDPSRFEVVVREEVA